MNEADWQRAKELFDLASALERADWESFLRSQEGTSEEIISMVLDLLAEDEDAGSFLQSPGEIFGASGPGSEAFLGREFGGLRIIKQLGAGGMGVVYRAQDTELLRDVAVKFLPRHASLDPTTVRRFRREGQRIARLKHPSIVAIQRLDIYDGCPYFVMDFIDGHDLAQEIQLHSEKTSTTTILPARSTPEYQRAAAKLTADIADALSAAHAASIVHRDVKPNNILLDKQGNVFLADFGIARDEIFGTAQPTLIPMGTTYYMSPEQAQVAVMRVDHRTDIYSLGVVLYELLALKRPFEGTTKEAVITDIIQKEPRKPSLIRADIHHTLDTICMKAMAKDPNDRYPHAAAFRADLEAFLRGASVNPGSTAWLPRTARRFRRNKPQFVAAVVTLLVALTAFSAWAAFRMSEEEIRGLTGLQLTIGADVPHDDITNVTLHPIDRWSGQPLPGQDLGRPPLTRDNLPPNLYRMVVRFRDGRYGEYDRALDLGPRTTVTINPLPSEELIREGMVEIAGATITPLIPLGARPSPAGPIEVAAFLLDTREVSNREYERFCAATGRELPTLFRITDPVDRNDSFYDRPVVYVSYSDALSYAEWVGKRLPTFAEFLLAARGPDQTSLPWRSNLSPEDVDAAVFAPNINREPIGTATLAHYLAHTRPVNSSPLARTPEGVNHLYGNVSEWTSSAGSGERGAEDIALNVRLVLGGYHSGGIVTDSRWIRASHNTGLNVSYSTGFRCAKSLIR